MQSDITGQGILSAYPFLHRPDERQDYHRMWHTSMVWWSDTKGASRGRTHGEGGTWSNPDGSEECKTEEGR